MDLMTWPRKTPRSPFRVSVGRSSLAFFLIGNICEAHAQLLTSEIAESPLVALCTDRTIQLRQDSL